MENLLHAVLGLAVLLASLVIHESAHALVALWLGDDTGKKAGRITLNPIKHLDLVGSIILPALLYFSSSGAFTFGYAKPVPVNVSKLRGTDRLGFATVALAGPFSNFVLAFIGAIALSDRALLWLSGVGVPISITERLVVDVVLWNITIAAFNLLPIPPLDGSRLLRLFLSANARQTLDRVEPFGFLILFALIMWLDKPLFRVVGLISDQLVRFLPI